MSRLWQPFPGYGNPFQSIFAINISQCSLCIVPSSSTYNSYKFEKFTIIASITDHQSTQTLKKAEEVDYTHRFHFLGPFSL